MSGTLFFRIEFDPSLIPKQGAKSLLLKVPVVGKDHGQSFLPHRRHGNAIRQTVALIRARCVESQTRTEGVSPLRDNLHTGRFENALGIDDGFATHRLGRRGKESEVLRQDLIGGDDQGVSPTPHNQVDLTPFAGLCRSEMSWP